MVEISKLFEKNHFQKRNVLPITTFEEVEKKVNFSLPDDYKFYAENYIENERFIGNEYFRLWNFDEILEINSEYKIFENLKNTIAIGSNGSAEFIAIENFKDDKYRIVLCPFIGSNQTSHIEIGSSFTNFLERLEAHKDWFEQ